MAEEACDPGLGGPARTGARLGAAVLFSVFPTVQFPFWGQRQQPCSFQVCLERPQ